MTLQIESPKVYTSQGVPITVTGIAQVKIQGQNEEMLMNACEQFLGKTSIKEIEKVALGNSCHSQIKVLLHELNSESHGVILSFENIMDIVKLRKVR